MIICGTNGFMTVESSIWTSCQFATIGERLVRVVFFLGLGLSADRRDAVQRHSGADESGVRPVAVAARLAGSVLLGRTDRRNVMCETDFEVTLERSSFGGPSCG